MQAWLSVFLAALVAAPPVVAGKLPADGFEGCSQHFFRGFVPRTQAERPPGKLRELCFDGFAVLHSGQAKTPVFVAEYLTPERLADAKGEVRSNRFYEEARIPNSERARLEDYKGNDGGWVRGHMAPAADMPDPTAMAQSFSLANTVPQAAKNNSGVWARAVEKATRSYVQRGNPVYAITGPIYQGSVKTMGPGQVWVPTALFKLVYDPRRRNAWVYVVDNVDSARMYAPLKYAEFVALTGTNYLPAGAVNPESEASRPGGRP